MLAHPGSMQRALTGWGGRSCPARRAVWAPVVTSHKKIAPPSKEPEASREVCQRAQCSDSTSGVPHQASGLVPGRRVPELDRSVPRSPRRAAHPQQQVQPEERTAVTVKARGRGRCRDVPQPDGPVPAARSEPTVRQRAQCVD